MKVFPATIGCRVWRLLMAGMVLPVAPGVSAESAQTIWRWGWDEPTTAPSEGGPGGVVASPVVAPNFFRAVARAGGREVLFRSTEGIGLREATEQGRIDVGLSVARTPEREAYVRFSAPYREARQVLCVRATDLDRFRFKTIPDLLAGVRSDGMRIGVDPGVAFASPGIGEIGGDPANPPWVFPGDSDAENLAELAAGDLDTVICDQLVAATRWGRGVA